MGSLLVIDDEKAILELIQQAMSRFGWTVVTAENGEQGLTIFQKGHFDVVMTDIRMPGIDGQEVLGRIRSMEVKSTIIIGMSGTPWNLEDRGFDAVLVKPFSLKVLADTLDRLTKTPLRNVAIA